MLTLLTLPLRRKSDTLLARFRARQIAGLCRFDIQEQTCIAAGAFTVAVHALRQCRTGTLCFVLENNTLAVYPDNTGARRGRPGAGPSADALLRLVKPLPQAAAEFAPEDLAWLLGQLQSQIAFQMFEEIHHQNEEILALLHTLRTTQEELQLLKEQAKPSAA
jgi:hypothetical protein